MTSVCAPTGSIALTVLRPVQLAKGQFDSTPKVGSKSFLLAVLVVVCASINAQQLQNLLLFDPFRNIWKRKTIDGECEIV